MKLILIFLIFNSLAINASTKNTESIQLYCSYPGEINFNWGKTKYSNQSTTYADPLFKTFDNLYNYSFPIFYLDNVKTNKIVKFKLKQKTNKTYQINLIVNDLNTINNQTKYEIKNNEKCTLIINEGKSVHYFELCIVNNELIENHTLGGISIKPLSFYYNKKWNIVVTNDVLGTKIYQPGLKHEGKKIQYVTNLQPHYFNDSLFVFSNINDETLVIDKTYSPKNNYEGITNGYYLDPKVLNNSTEFNIDNKVKLFYFWGIWCKPCLDKMPEVLQTYNKTLNSDKISFKFNAFCINESDVFKSTNYLKKMKISHNDILTTNSRDINLKMHINNNKNSLFEYLKIFSFPTFVAIDKNGKILYRGNSLEKFRNQIPIDN